jgi:DNA polymerase III epsilon subunit-like protein
LPRKSGRNAKFEVVASPQATTLQTTMRTLFFDTETSGLPIQRTIPASEKPNNWPHLVSLSWIVTEDKANVSTKSYIIKPKDNWVYSPESVAKHKISLAFATEVGEPITHVLAEFLRDLRRAEIVIAHNMEFDKNTVISAIMYDCEKEMGFKWPRYEFCTMEGGRAVCKLRFPVLRMNDRFKPPTLTELYKHAFGIHPPEELLHTSLGDTQIMVASFFRLWILEDLVHQAHAVRQAAPSKIHAAPSLIV